MISKFKQFVKNSSDFQWYNLTVGITWITAYAIQVYFIDYLKYPAFIIILVISIITHLTRYYAIYKVRNVK